MTATARPLAVNTRSVMRTEPISFGVHLVCTGGQQSPKTAFLTIRGRTRTCNLRLRRPTLYPIELRGQSSFIVPWGGFLSHRRRRVGANKARVCPKSVLNRPRKPTLGDRGANNVELEAS